MKPLTSIALSLLCAGWGALAHHVMEFRVQPRSERSPRRMLLPASPDQSRSSASMVGMVDHLLACVIDSDNVDWIALDESLSSLKAGEVSHLLRELSRRGVNPMGEFPLWHAIVEYASVIDSKSLIVFAAGTGDVRCLHSVGAACFAREPDAYLAAVKHWEASSDKDPKKKAEQVESLLEGAFSRISQHDPAKALAIAARTQLLDRPGRLHWLTRAAESWAKQDPAAAMAFAKEHPSMQKTIFNAWGGEDPDAAERWLKANVKPEETESDPNDPFDAPSDPMADVFLEYARTHPKDALRFMERTGSKEDFYRNQAEGMAREPVSDSAAWVQTLPENMRLVAGAIIAQHLSETDPESAVAFCQKFPGVVADSAGQRIMEEWSYRDPAAACRFLESPSVPVEIREQILPYRVNTWLKIDREAAINFIAGQPASEAKGRMLLDASQIMQDGGREAAREFALSLPDLTLRIGACRGIFDPLTAGYSDKAKFDEAFAAWIASIPDAAVRKALTPPPPPPVEPERGPSLPVEDPFGR